MVYDSIILISQKKMLLTAIKLTGAYISLGAILLKTQVFNWGEYGILGLVIGAFFYFLLRPMMNMLIEDKKSDNEIKKKLVDYINALSLVLREHTVKSQGRFDDLKESLENLDKKLDSIDKNLREINEGIGKLNLNKGRA